MPDFFQVRLLAGAVSLLSCLQHRPHAVSFTAATPTVSGRARRFNLLYQWEQWFFMGNAFNVRVTGVARYPAGASG